MTLSFNNIHTLPVLLLKNSTVLLFLLRLFLFNSKGHIISHNIKNVFIHKLNVIIITTYICRTVTVIPYNKVAGKIVGKWTVGPSKSGFCDFTSILWVFIENFGKLLVKNRKKVREKEKI